MSIRRVCIFCGSQRGRDPRFAQAARELAQAAVGRGWGVVFGGGQVGLMGTVADQVLALGGELIGVIPRSLATRELAHPRATTMHVVENMHQRKALMAQLADAFVALPGGYGTLEELMEVITWAQLGIHRKPIGVLNTLGYYDPWQEMIHQAVKQGFLHPEYLRVFVVEKEPQALLAQLERFSPVQLPQWMKVDET